MLMDIWEMSIEQMMIETSVSIADDNVNTSTQSDVLLLKWNHHIQIN